MNACGGTFEVCFMTWVYSHMRAVDIRALLLLHTQCVNEIFTFIAHKTKQGITALQKDMGMLSPCVPAHYNPGVVGGSFPRGNYTGGSCLGHVEVVLGGSCLDDDCLR